MKLQNDSAVPISTKNFFHHWPKNMKKMSKLPLAQKHALQRKKIASGQ